jgi:tetratricopeptide (TPR) repeat protein
MRQHRIVAYAGMLLLSCTVWMSASRSLAWAQAPSDAAIFVDRAILAYDSQQYDQAMRELQEALRIDPNNVEALFFQGLVYTARDRRPEAMAVWERARQLRPSDIDVAFQLGVLYFADGQYDRAMPLLQQVYQVEPGRLNLGYYLGFMEYRRKNYRRAIDYLRANVPSDDNFAQLTRFYVGLAMGALGFPAQARAEVEEALRLQPVSPLVLPAQRFGEELARAAARERRFSGELQFGLFYDSNVPVVPNASSDLVAQVLRQDQSDRDSIGELGTLSLAYTWLKTLDWEGTVAYRFLQTYNNDLPDFNVQDHTPTLGFVYRDSLFDMLYFAGIQMAYDFITLGGDKFVQRGIANPYFSLFESPRNLTTFEVRLQAKDFFDDDNIEPEEVRDGFNYLIGAVHFFLFGEGRHFIKLGYQFDYDATEGSNWEYAGHHIIFGAQYTLPWQDIRLRYELDFHLRDYTHNNSLIPVEAPGTMRRRDREAIHLLSVAKDFVFKSQKFSASVQYLFDDNNSNLDPYAYDRHVVTTSLTWRF